jgi:hypothetical protein
MELAGASELGHSSAQQQRAAQEAERGSGRRTAAARTQQRLLPQQPSRRRTMPALVVDSARELVHLIVKAGSLWDVKVAARAGQRLSCSFITQGLGDIGFTALSIVGATTDGDVYGRQPEVLEPEALCRSGSVVYQVREDGVVLLRFDNQHSWTRSKSVELSVESRVVQSAAPGAADAPVLTARQQLERKMDAWLATIPIGMGGAEGATSQRSYDPKPMVEFALRESHERETADEIYRLYVERQVQDAEEEMVAQGVLPVEPDGELLALADHCASLDHAALCSARTRRHLERRLCDAMEAHSTFLVGAMHGVGWDWVASRFAGVPDEQAIWRIGEACVKWAHSPNRVKQAASARKRKSRKERRKQSPQRPAGAAPTAASSTPGPELEPEPEPEPEPESGQLADGSCTPRPSVPPLPATASSTPETPRAQQQQGQEGQEEEYHATLHVAAGSSKDFPVTVPEGGAHVQWGFDVSAHGGSTFSSEMVRDSELLTHFVLMICDRRAAVLSSHSWRYHERICFTGRPLSAMMPMVCCAVLCCAVLCCAVPGRAVLGRAVPCRAVWDWWSRWVVIFPSRRSFLQAWRPLPGTCTRPGRTRT